MPVLPFGPTLQDRRPKRPKIHGYTKAAVILYISGDTYVGFTKEWAAEWGLASSTSLSVKRLPPAAQTRPKKMLKIELLKRIVRPHVSLCD